VLKINHLAMIFSPCAGTNHTSNINPLGIRCFAHTHSKFNLLNTHTQRALPITEKPLVANASERRCHPTADLPIFIRDGPIGQYCRRRRAQRRTRT